MPSAVPPFNSLSCNVWTNERYHITRAIGATGSIVWQCVRAKWPPLVAVSQALLLLTLHVCRVPTVASTYLSSLRAGVTLTAYCGDRILCAATDVHTDRLLFYKEPPPEPVGDLAAALGGGGVPVHKMIFMADQDRWVGRAGAVVRASSRHTVASSRNAVEPCAVGAHMRTA